MTVSVQWDDSDSTRLRLEFVPGWSWRLFVEVWQTTLALAGDRCVSVIFDLAATRTLPDGAMTHLRDAFKDVGTFDFIVVVASAPDINAIFDVIRRVQPDVAQRLVTVPTLDAARAALEHPTTLRMRIFPAQLGDQ